MTGLYEKWEKCKGKQEYREPFGRVGLDERKILKWIMN
jgi:hypothetical protein